MNVRTFFGQATLVESPNCAEIEYARKWWVVVSQMQSFPEEHQALSNNNEEIEENSPLCKLNPMLHKSLLLCKEGSDICMIRICLLRKDIQ